MSSCLRAAALLLAVALVAFGGLAEAQQIDSFPWRDSVRGPDLFTAGSPRSTITADSSSFKWCLQPTGRSTGDLGWLGRSWMDATREKLLQVLSDTTSDGSEWRQAIGGAPQLAPDDSSFVQVLDESTCHSIAVILHREFLGWPTGPPPVVVIQVREFLVAFPANLDLGEFGLAVGMTLAHELRGVTLW